MIKTYIVFQILKIDWRMWLGAGHGYAKDAEKLKMMLLAWNYHSQAQGNYTECLLPPAGFTETGDWALAMIFIGSYRET